MSHYTFKPPSYSKHTWDKSIVNNLTNSLY